MVLIDITRQNTDNELYFMKYYFTLIASTSRKVKIALCLGLIALLISLSFLYHHIKSKNANDKAISVLTAEAKNDDVSVYITALGNVTPEYSVTVKAQVSGQLMKVLFKDGQQVKTGDMLAQIDRRPYEAQLLQYQGQLEHDMALLENTNIDLKRYQTLWKQNSVSKQVLDTQIALVKQYEGTVKLDEGLLDNAKVNLSYCDITSPIDGQVGIRQIDEGNFIQAASNIEIAVINSVNPIMVIFSIPENELSAVLNAFNKDNNLETIAYDQDQKKPVASGTLLAIDNQIDPTTGTVKLKATFKNDNNILFPNQFVNIKLRLNNLKDVIIIPAAAVQFGPNGSFVYKLTDNDRVKVVQVETGVTRDNDIVITSGIVKGDIVVIAGADKLTEGAIVKTGKKNEHF